LALGLLHSKNLRLPYMFSLPSAPWSTSSQRTFLVERKRHRHLSCPAPSPRVEFAIWTLQSSDLVFCDCAAECWCHWTCLDKWLCFLALGLLRSKKIDVTIHVSFAFGVRQKPYITSNSDLLPSTCLFREDESSKVKKGQGMFRELEGMRIFPKKRLDRLWFGNS